MDHIPIAVGQLLETTPAALVGRHRVRLDPSAVGVLTEIHTGFRASVHVSGINRLRRLRDKAWNNEPEDKQKEENSTHLAPHDKFSINAFRSMLVDKFVDSSNKMRFGVGAVV